MDLHTSKLLIRYNLNNKPLKRKHQEDSNSQYFPNTDKRSRGNDSTYFYNNRNYYYKNNISNENHYYKRPLDPTDSKELRETLYQHINNHEINQVCDILSKIPNKNTYSFENLCKAMIYCCTKNKKAQDAAYLFKELQKLNSNLRKDPKLYTSVIQCCAQYNNTDDTVALFEKMICNKIQPSKQLYTAVINCCVRNNRIDGTIQFLNNMLYNKIKPDEQLYTAVIQNCIKHNNIYYTIKFFERMCQANIQPHEKLYNAIIQFCAKQKKFAHMMLFFNRMLDNNIKPNEILCTTIIKYAIIKDKTSSPIELFYKIIKYYTHMNCMLYVTAITRCIEEGHIKDANEILELGLKNGVFYSNFGLNGNKLNLHRNAIIKNCNDRRGVPCVFGKFMLDKVISYNNLNSIIIVVGQYGENHLKDMVLEYAKEMNYTININKWNPGRIYLNRYPK